MRRFAAMLGLVVLAGCGVQSEGTTSTAGFETSGAPEQVIPGNPTCQDVFGSGSIEFKVEPPQNGTFPLGDGLNSATVLNSDGYVFDWTATLAMDGVIVKGGNNANVYSYDPEAKDDSGLHAPINPNTGKPYGLSHISFCFDYEVVVTKTANTSFDRTYSWEVTKAADTSQITISASETATVGYSVTVSQAGYQDSNFAVAGTIEVLNPAPFFAVVTGVTDVISGAGADIQVPVSCPVTFPYMLLPGDTLVCSYSTPLGDAASRTNTATATTTGKVGQGSGSAPVDFGNAQIAGIDECVTVDDNRAGTLGQVCASDPLPKVLTYTLELGPYGSCGRTIFDNTATITAEDSGATGSASAQVQVDVPCTGCTLTPGYWKTHSTYGPAPYDSVWGDFGGADKMFYLSGQSYHDVLWTAPRGNAYYILAHAFIAAQLNIFGGVAMNYVEGTYQQAEAFLENYTPADVLQNKGLKGTIVPLAKVLDDFNNGLIGPGHCD